MKYTKFILAAIFSLTSLSALCCGPYVAEIPRPSFLRIQVPEESSGTRHENILLWQSQTSPHISPADIKEIIYGDSMPETNSFLRYLNDTRDNEAIDFIMLAKKIADMRALRNSPWFYPESKNDQSHAFDPIIDTILAYKGSRFRNRYSLQLIRALFASERYADCIDAFSNRFADVPDHDLMKRMSRDYVAGAATRLGNSATAIEHFASNGDVESLARYTHCPHPFRLAALSAPDSPRLINFIDNKFNGDGIFPPSPADSAFVREEIIPVARQIAARQDIASRAMWLYILAVAEGEFNADYNAAHRYIAQAEDCNADHIADNIHTYRILTEAAIGLRDNSLHNLRWLESKISTSGQFHKSYWIDVMRNIVCSRLIPLYASHGDIITALRLANYADNLYPADGYWSACDIDLARLDPEYRNNHDFANSFFQFITALSPDTVEQYIAALNSSEPLASYLNSRGYTSSDYLYDIAGTLYLRQRDYHNAARVLAKVSGRYQSLLNTDRQGFLRRAPFLYQSPEVKENWLSEHKKLIFACQMAHLEHEMISSDLNRRNLAAIIYSIGLENSFTTCWALTAYSRGENYVDDIIDYHSGNWPGLSPFTEQQTIDRAIADAAEIRSRALAGITDPETAAQAHQMLHNFHTIAGRYPETAVARYLSSRCDSFRDWQ